MAISAIFFFGICSIGASGAIYASGASDSIRVRGSLGARVKGIQVHRGDQ